MIDGMTVASLSASLKIKTSVAREHYGKSCFTKKYHTSSVPNHVKAKVIA